MSPKWTDEEIQILKECYKNMEPVASIMEKLPGRTYGGISAKAQKLGLTELYIKPNNANYKADYNDYDWCYDKFIKNGMKISQISKETGYKPRVLEKWIYEKYKLDYKRDFRLNDLQKMVIVSGCLGDGHISKRLAYIESHAENQKDYIWWKFNILRNMCNIEEPTYYPEAIKYFGDKPYTCQPSYRVTTREIMDLANIAEMTRLEKIDYLDELGFSLHFLDDGYYNGYNWHICLAEWSNEEKQLYLKKLMDLFGVNGWLQKDDRYTTIDKASSNKMNEIILKNLPIDLDIIKYKIIEKVVA